MKTTLLVVSLLTAATIHAAVPVTATFTGVRSERTWPLKELNSELPADWTPYDFLVLEFRASSSQRFELSLEAGTPR